MKSSIKYTTLFLFLTTFLLSACENTVQGFGKDMEVTGQKIQKSVDDDQHHH